MSSKPKILYGLSPNHTHRAAKDFVDFDYVHLLSDEERAWLDRFGREYYQKSFTNTAADLFPEKTAQRRAIYGDGNARDRDMWNKFNRELESESGPDGDSEDSE